MVITVTREYGAGGSAIAQRVAERLGWQLVDGDLVERVALRAGLPPEEVAEKEEWAPGFLERLARVLTASAPPIVAPEDTGAHEMEEARLVRVTETVVRELAVEGRKVLVGRAAPAVIGQDLGAFHVRVVAPKAWRLRAAAARLLVSDADAQRILEETDGKRARYHKLYYNRDWKDPVHYDLTINTARTGLEGAVEIIVGRARALGWDEEPDSSS